MAANSLFSITEIKAADRKSAPLMVPMTDEWFGHSRYSTSVAPVNQHSDENDSAGGSRNDRVNRADSRQSSGDG